MAAFGRPARTGLLVLVAVALAILAYRLTTREGEGLPGTPQLAADDSARAPVGVRVRVEVLNASGVRGLARRATMELRDRGFDVVEIGNAPSRRDSTLILSRAGQPEWAARVARALGGAPVEARPDSGRYVEVSVLLGGDWSPPPGPFRP